MEERQSGANQRYAPNPTPATIATVTTIVISKTFLWRVRSPTAISESEAAAWPEAEVPPPESVGGTAPVSLWAATSEKVAERLVSVSRFRRWKSARISAACWYRKRGSFSRALVL